MEEHGGDEIKRMCMYRLDDSTGEVNPSGQWILERLGDDGL